jgi:hypothetical protein
LWCAGRKSSVAQAGVLAALRSQLWPGGHGSWPAELADSRAGLQVTIRPGEALLKELALGFAWIVANLNHATMPVDQVMQMQLSTTDSRP